MTRAEQLWQILGVVHHHIGGIRAPACAAQSRRSRRRSTGRHCARWPHPRAESPTISVFSGRGSGFPQNRLRALGIGLLGGKAVAAVDADEEIAQPQRLHNRPRGFTGLLESTAILRGGRFAGIAGRTAPPSCRRTPWCGPACVLGSRPGNTPARCWTSASSSASAPKSAADQHGRAVAYVAGNQVFGQFGTPQVPQRGVDRVHQVEAGVDQRAIEVEDEQLDGLGVELAMEADHWIFQDSIR